MPNYTVEQAGRNVHVIRVPVERWEGWSFSVLMTSDQHTDHIASDRDMQIDHLEELKARDGLGLSFGDTFCLMQGKYDKRSSIHALRPEYIATTPLHYYESVRRDLIDFYGPYAPWMRVWGLGNHETSWTEKHAVCPIRDLVKGLNQDYKGDCYASGYTGWVKFQFQRNNERYGRTLTFTHGHGGAAPMSEGIMQSKREVITLDNTDIHVSGHNHYSWHHEGVRALLDANNKQVLRPLHLVKLPTYKDEFGDGYGGWSVEKGQGPRPKGAHWLEFRWHRKRGLQMHLTRAI